jgi:surface antigen
MLRAVLISIPLCLAPVAAAAPAAAKGRQPPGQCDSGKKQRNSMIGGFLGGLASRAGIPSSVGGVGLPTSELLSEAITALLDCKEQQQAATATNEAIRGGVGTTSSWQSESRANVSGSSTVTGQERLADGSQCMTVSDVVIVDGEETTVPKRMCRPPGGGGYRRV